MEQPTFGSPDGPCEKNSDLRVALRKLIEAHGADTVKRVLNSIEAANPVENPRSRGRPVGPAINDWPSLKRAATIWRQQGGGPVWPALIAVAKSLHGESESNARRLLSRLLKLGRDWDGQFERAGIHDFRMAAWNRRIDRAVTRAGPRYRQALATAAMYWAQLFDPGTHPVLTDMIRRTSRQEFPLTLEDIVILTQDSPAAAVLPCSLVYDGSRYYLIFRRIFVSDRYGPPINVKEVVIRDKDSAAQTSLLRVYYLPVPDIASLLDHSPFC